MSTVQIVLFLSSICFHIVQPFEFELLVSFSLMFLPMLGLIYVQCVFSFLYTAFYLQGAICFLHPNLLLILSKYCCVIWNTLFLIAFYTQTGGSAPFPPFTINIACISHIHILLFLSFAPVIRILMMSSCLLHYNALVFHLEPRSLSDLVVYSFFILDLGFLSVFLHPSFHSV